MASKDPSAVFDAEINFETVREQSDVSLLTLKCASRCPGCRALHTDHVWGQPGPNCQGQEAGEEDCDAASEVWHAQTGVSIIAIADESISATVVSTAAVDASRDCSFPSDLPVLENRVSGHQSDRQALEAKLSALLLEEQQLDELAKLHQLRLFVAEREASIAQKRQQLASKAVAMTTMSQPHQNENRAYLAYQTLTSGIAAAFQCSTRSAGKFAGFPTNAGR